MPVEFTDQMEGIDWAQLAVVFERHRWAAGIPLSCSVRLRTARFDVSFGTPVSLSEQVAR